MKFFFLLVLSLFPIVSFAYDSQTLVNNSGDYVQIFAHSLETRSRVVDAFKRTQYTVVDVTINISSVKQEKTWCDIKVVAADDITVTCRERLNAASERVTTLTASQGNYSKIPLLLAEFRKSSYHKKIARHT